MFDLDYLSSKNMAPNLYIHTVSSQYLSTAYIDSLLEKEQDAHFVYIAAWDKFKRGYDKPALKHIKQTLKQHCQSVYFLGESVAKQSLETIASDLDKINFAPKGLPILVFPDQVLVDSDFKRRHAFAHIVRKISQKFKKPILVVIHGYEHQFMHSEIMRYPELYSGLLNLQAIDQNHRYLNVHFWSSHAGLFYDKQYDLVYKDELNRLSLKDPVNQVDDGAQITDDSQIYMSKYAQASQQSSSDNLHIFESNQDVLDMHISDYGTVVFSLSEQSEVKALGVLCLRLRRKYGENLKIAIREIRQCLRYSDEMFLTKAGANVIIGSNINYARFLNMLETLQGQVLKRNLPSSVEHLLTFHTSSGRKGYVPNAIFLEHVKELIARYDESQTQFALIKFNTMPNIEMSAYLSMWDIKRDGDIITTCEDSIYLLLNSVRENNISVALKNIFRIPVGDAFLSQQNFTTINRIEHELTYIQDHGVDISFDSKILDAYFSPKDVVSEDKQSTQIHFATHTPWSDA